MKTAKCDQQCEEQALCECWPVWYGCQHIYYLFHTPPVAMKSGIVTASTRSVVTENAIATDRAEKKRKGTERGGIERRRRDVTSPLAGK